MRLESKLAAASSSIEVRCQNVISGGGNGEEINFCRHDWLPSIVAGIMTRKDLRM
jgi:hypothetical protein